MGNSNLTIPNLLSLVRILLTPGFVMAFLSENYGLAWLLFGVAGVTDALDGIIAKRFNQRSPLGAILDPLADKTLLVTAFLSLAIKGWVPYWLAVLVISRDVIIVLGLTVLTMFSVEVRELIKPIITSKLNTTFQILVIVFVLAERTFGFSAPFLRGALFTGVALFTLLSGYSYVRTGFRAFPPQQN